MRSHRIARHRNLTERGGVGLHGLRVPPGNRRLLSRPFRFAGTQRLGKIVKIDSSIIAGVLLQVKSNPAFFYSQGYFVKRMNRDRAKRLRPLRLGQEDVDGEMTGTAG
jgi:hypothetical protein